MLISETTGDFELLSGVEQAAKMGDRLAACIEAARGAFSYNTQRALRANVEIFAFWCRQHVLEAVPASAATVVAFIDDMARVKAPWTPPLLVFSASFAPLRAALTLASPEGST